MRLRALVLPLLLVTAAVGVSVGMPVASAATESHVFLDEISGAGPDNLVVYDGDGFTPGQQVTVAIVAESDGSTHAMPSGTADANGDVHSAKGTRTPADLVPDWYRLTMTQSGDPTVSSAPFRIVPPSVTWPTTLIPGSSVDVILRGLGAGPDVHRQVTLDGDAVASTAFENVQGSVGQYFTVPNQIGTGPHTIAVTQDVNPAWSGSVVVNVPPPTLTSSTTGSPLGTDARFSVSGSGFGTADVVAITVTGGAGEVHTMPDGTGPRPSLYATVTNLSPGTVTVTFVSRLNHAHAAISFAVQPHAATAPATLAPGSQLVLDGPQTYAAVQTDGNLVVRNFGSAIWTSNTPGHPNATLSLQSDANLVLRDAAGRAYWSTGTAGFGPGARLALGIDSDLTLTAANGRPLWSTTTLPNTLSVPYVTEVLAGHGLPKGALIASNLFAPTFGIRADGTAVITDGRGRVVWSTGTGGHPNSYVSLQTDGNLVIRSATNAALWANNARCGPGARLVMQTDGNLVERAANGTAAWTSRTVVSS